MCYIEFYTTSALTGFNSDLSHVIVQFNWLKYAHPPNASLLQLTQERTVYQFTDLAD